LHGFFRSFGIGRIGELFVVFRKEERYASSWGFQEDLRVSVFRLIGM